MKQFKMRSKPQTPKQPDLSYKRISAKFDITNCDYSIHDIISHLQYEGLSDDEIYKCIIKTENFLDNMYIEYTRPETKTERERRISSETKAYDKAIKRQQEYEAWQKEYAKEIQEYKENQKQRKEKQKQAQIAKLEKELARLKRQE